MLKRIKFVRLARRGSMPENFVDPIACRAFVAWTLRVDSVVVQLRQLTLSNSYNMRYDDMKHRQVHRALPST